MQTQVTLIGISRFLSADEIDDLVRTAAEAVCGQLDDLSTRQLDLATRAHTLLTADTPPDTIDGPPHPAKAAAEVWLLRHDDKHGDDISLYASRALGLGALAQTVRSRWDNITGNPGVPATGDSLADEASRRDVLQAPDRHRELLALQRGCERCPQCAPAVRAVRDRLGDADRASRYHRRRAPQPP